MGKEGREGEEEKRIKRDEWSDGAVDCLLESYEAKWVLRNRAKLKGQDWEDVATQVSLKESSDPRKGSNVKTATQCKNKIESMKKRYRNEVASSDGKSRWPLFSKIDGLVRCRTGAPNLNEEATQVDNEGVENKEQTDEANKEVEKKEESEPTLKENVETKRENGKRKREKNEEGNETLESTIKWFGEVMLRVEQARMEGMKEVEKIRAETKARKSEMELKRIEIIANTQIEIAKLFARRCVRK